MFKTPQDLSTFLKMHANTFHVQSSLVTLVQRRNDTSNITTTTTTTTTVVNQENSNLGSDNTTDNCNNNENIIVESNNNNNNNVNLTSETESPLPAPSKQAPKIMSLRQRINSLVMKTLADNTERDRIVSQTANHIGGKVI
jgi:hypothetical protein